MYLVDLDAGSMFRLLKYKKNEEFSFLDMIFFLATNVIDVEVLMRNEVLRI